MVYAHVSSLEGRALCTRLHTHTYTHTHFSQIKKQAVSTLYQKKLYFKKISHCHCKVRILVFLPSYMVQNTSDIIYSVNKYCQVEMFLK